MTKRGKEGGKPFSVSFVLDFYSLYPNDKHVLKALGPRASIQRIRFQKFKGLVCDYKPVQNFVKGHVRKMPAENLNVTNGITQFYASLVLSRGRAGYCR